MRAPLSQVLLLERASYSGCYKPQIRERIPKMAENPPYMNAYGKISPILEKIKVASTPPRFTQDFLETKLGFPSSSVRAILPLLKRLGFLGSDGVPTEIYKRLRNSSQSKAAMAQAINIGYKDLYSQNEYLHELSDKDLKGHIVSATGLEHGSKVVDAIVGTFKALKAFASFDKDQEEILEKAPPPDSLALPSQVTPQAGVSPQNGIGMNLSYTINLNLPATTDINVFNAIFKSLRENMLRRTD
jgi:hypothetical protein